MSYMRVMLSKLTALSAKYSDLYRRGRVVNQLSESMHNMIVGKVGVM